MIKKFTTKPKFINVKNANTITFKIIFSWNYELNNKTKDSILENIFARSNGKYPNNKDFIVKKQELLIIRYSTRIEYFTDKTTLSFDLTIPKEGLFENYSMESCLEFFYDCIFNVSAINGEFLEENFNSEKDYVYFIMKNYPSSIYDYLHRERVEAINSLEKVFLTRDEVLNNLDNMTSKSLYDYYEKNIKNASYVTYIYGNLENKDKIYNLYQKYFKQKYQKISMDINLFRILKPGKYEKKVINVNYEQSVLKLIYQFDNMKENEIILLETLYFFLYSRENNLLHNVLRNKYHLIYGLDVLKNIYGHIEMDIFLDKKDIEKVKELINMTLSDIKVENNFNIYKKRLLKSMRYDDYFERDNIFYKVDKKLYDELAPLPSLEENRRMIKTIDFATMKNFLDRINLVKEIILIGDKNV